jgi:hypothetical protein
VTPAHVCEPTHVRYFAASNAGFPPLPMNDAGMFSHVMDHQREHLICLYLLCRRRPYVYLNCKLFVTATHGAIAVTVTVKMISQMGLSTQQ